MTEFSLDALGGNFTEISLRRNGELDRIPKVRSTEETEVELA